MKKIEQLKAERLELLAKQNDIHAQLRHLKNNERAETDPLAKEALKKDIGRAIHTCGRITTRLIEVKQEIKIENMRLNGNKIGAAA